MLADPGARDATKYTEFPLILIMDVHDSETGLVGDEAHFGERWAVGRLGDYNRVAVAQRVLLGLLDAIFGLEWLGLFQESDFLAEVEHFVAGEPKGVQK